MTQPIIDIVDLYIDNMFKKTSIEYDLKSEDIDPADVARLDSIKNDLYDLLGDYVYINLEVEK